MWIILRTEARKEQYVTRQVMSMGWDAWTPTQVIACRPSIARRIMSKTQLQTYREICLLPRRVFAAAPVAAEADLLRIRYAQALERNAASEALLIPDRQVREFKAEIDRENTAALALATRPSRKQKAKWKSLHDALVEMIQGAREQLEQAA